MAVHVTTRPVAWELRVQITGAVDINASDWQTRTPGTNHRRDTHTGAALCKASAPEGVRCTSGVQQNLLDTCTPVSPAL